MKFEETLQALRDGMKIIRKAWHPIEELSLKEENATIKIRDLLADDWEIVKEGKESKKTIKVKLRDLTIKQYKKWLKSNCDVRCNNCIFKKVDCLIADSVLWVKNKDVYNDKFLDQEVEIYE